MNNLTKTIHLWPEKVLEHNGTITVSVILEQSEQQARQQLWYRLPLEYKSLVTSTCDPFVVGTIFTAMRAAADMVVHGEVSPSLLRNLEEFQSAWHCWLPDRYTKINISADVEQESSKSDTSEAIVAFSGGVDSCFTIWRHKTGRCGRLQCNIKAGLMIHGFDIPLDQEDVFHSAQKRSAKMLNSLGIELIPMATNFRDLGDDWEDCHAAGFVSCLMMLKNEYDVGLLASSPSYKHLVLPWGSNPVTDGLLSGKRFQLIHDGGSYNRMEKIQEISDWPEALSYLRVCWQGDHKDRNCCQCEKYIRTILMFRVLALGLPPCFEKNVSNTQIINLNRLNAHLIAEYTPILSVAKKKSISDSWVRALKLCLLFNRFRLKAKQIVWLRRLYQSVVH